MKNIGIATISHLPGKYFLLFLCALSSTITIHPMLLQLSKHVHRNRYFLPRQPSVIQKRSRWSHKNFQKLSDLIPEDVSHISPLYGAALMESNALKRMLLVNLSNPSPLVHIAHLLFYQNNPNEPVLPTANKSRAAYALSPNILGLIVGAMEKGKLNDQTDYLIHEWQMEYANITKEKKKISAKKIKELLSLMDEGYKRDKNGLYSILLAFLDGKANPENNHDLVDFLDGVNRYVPIFSAQENKFKNMLQEKFNANGRITNGYTSENYAAFVEELLDIDKQNKKISFAKNNFPLALSFLIEQKKSSNGYPPQVVADRKYSYNDQPPVPICVETALQDLFNNLLYDDTSKSFDLSLLPTSLQINSTFKNFYTMHRSIDIINAPSTAQAFVNLVSGIPGVSYHQKDHEINTENIVTSIIALCNHFFNSNVNNLLELGKALSDDRRTVVFSLQPLRPSLSSKVELTTEITIQIINNQNSFDKKTFSFYCVKAVGQQMYHALLETPKPAPKESFFSSSFLSQQYHTDPQCRALFLLNESCSVDMLTKKSPSIYYTLPVETDLQKIEVIKTILSHNREEKESVDYAYSLFTLTQEESWVNCAEQILLSDIFQDRLHENQALNTKFNNFIAKNVIHIIKETTGLNDTFIARFYQRINTDDLKQQLRAHLWNNRQESSIDQNIYHNIDLITFIVKGNLLFQDPVFDTKFHDLAITLLQNQETKQQFLSEIVSQNLLHDIYKTLHDESSKKIFLQGLMTISNKNLSLNIIHQRKLQALDFCNLLPATYQAPYLLYILKNFSTNDTQYDEKIVKKIHDLFLHDVSTVTKAIITNNYVADMYAIISNEKTKKMFFSELINMYESFSQIDQMKYTSYIINSRIFGFNEKFDKTLIKIIKNVCVFMDQKFQYKTTPLHIAVQAADPVLVKLILDSGAIVHVPDGKGQVPLFHARQLRSKGQNTADFDSIITMLTNAIKS